LILLSVLSYMSKLSLLERAPSYGGRRRRLPQFLEGRHRVLPPEHSCTSCWNDGFDAAALDTAVKPFFHVQVDFDGEGALVRRMAGKVWAAARPPAMRSVWEPGS